MFSCQIFIRSGGFHQPGMLSLWPTTRTGTNGLPPIRQLQYHFLMIFAILYFPARRKRHMTSQRSLHSVILMRIKVKLKDFSSLSLGSLLWLQTERKTRYRRQCSGSVSFRASVIRNYFLQIQILPSTIKKCNKSLISAVL